MICDVLYSGVGTLEECLPLYHEMITLHRTEMTAAATAAEQEKERNRDRPGQKDKSK